MRDAQETNETIALRAKAGDRAAAAALWARNRRLLAVLLGRLYRAWRPRAAAAGVTWEDVQQLEYFIVLRAAAGFDPARGQFSTLLAAAARTVFGDLVHLRAHRDDPLDAACRLEDPLPAAADGSQTLRGDLIADPAAAQDLETVEDRLCRAQLRADLEDALARLPPELAALLRARYCEGQPLAAVARVAGVPYAAARARQQKALQEMRRAKALRRWRNEMIATKATHHTGFAAWKEGGSVEEWLVERLEAYGSSATDGPDGPDMPA